MNRESAHVSAYPEHIAATFLQRWLERGLPATLLPDQRGLVQLVELAYQASLLREEGEPVRCRLMLCREEEFAEELRAGGSSLHVLRFLESAPATPHNIRKLAAAADYYRALLAVSVGAHGELHVWGMLVTGTQWVNRIEGGRDDGPKLPANPVIQAVGPGHLIAASGITSVLEARGGQLLMEGFDPFRSQWLPQRFAGVRESLLNDLHRIPGNPRIRMCDSFIKDVAQGVVRRTLRLVRGRGHGGLLVYLPDGAGETNLPDQWFRFRVRLKPDDSTRRFRRLMLRLMQRGIEVGDAQQMEVLRWTDYQQMQDAELAALDGELVRLAHLMADLMSIDGCFVMDRGFRLIGFGAEILSDSHVQTVQRALDLECRESVTERADTAGTRHRSAYRLVHSVPDAIAVVVSQDGDVRFVANHDGRVAYWPYLP